MKSLTDVELPEREHSEVSAPTTGVVKLYINGGRIFKKDESGVEQELTPSPLDQIIDGGTFN